MHLLILGAGGMLGSALQRECIAQGIRCTPLARAQADITDLENLNTICQQLQPSHIVNCAAFTDVDGAEKHRELAYLVNAEGARHVGCAALRIGAKLVHISTDYVFNGMGRCPYTETDATDPRGVYAGSKLAGERALVEVYPQACILRTSWLFGHGGKNFISSMLNIMGARAEVRVVADQKGRPTYAKDLAQAVLALIDHTGIFHFANTGEASRFELAQNIHREAKRLGRPLMCQAVAPALTSDFPTPAYRPPYSVLCTRKIEAALGQAPRPWQDALKEYLTDAK